MTAKSNDSQSMDDRTEKLSKDKAEEILQYRERYDGYVVRGAKRRLGRK
ncbi:MAG: hypothetical protein V5A72_03195 [Candidatus Nanohaloarchaea archaeon]